MVRIGDKVEYIGCSCAYQDFTKGNVYVIIALDERYTGAFHILSDAGKKSIVRLGTNFRLVK